MLVNFAGPVSRTVGGHRRYALRDSQSRQKGAGSVVAPGACGGGRSNPSDRQHVFT